MTDQPNPTAPPLPGGENENQEQPIQQPQPASAPQPQTPPPDQWTIPPAQPGADVDEGDLG